MSKLKDSIVRQYRLYKYRANSFPKTLDWDWKKTNYNRIALVNLLLATKGPDCSYLEIGCCENNLFDAVPVKNKVGVDPNLGGNYRGTSDEFFAQNQQKFDIIFIDGLHTYEQVHKDINNALQVLKKGGFIGLHDMIPRDWKEHHVPIVSDKAWTGDPWKTAYEIVKTPGIDFKILKIDHGVGVLRVVGDQTPQLADMKATLDSKNYDYFYNNMGQLPIMEWESIYEWVGHSRNTNAQGLSAH